MKLPNGYGTVYKLGGKRRKPYIARKTIGWTENGKQIFSTIGYYEKRDEALQALAAFNDNPYDLSMSKVAFSDIYRLWFDDVFTGDTNRSTKKNYTTAYDCCAALHNMKMADIRIAHMQRVIDEHPNYQTASRIKIFLNKLYNWCVDRDYVKKNYAKTLSIPKYEPQSERRAFTKEHIELFWQTVTHNENVPLVLMLIYSGVRINELLDLDKADVNLEEQWFKVRASKTHAGIRIVPIADKVLPYWAAYMEKSQCNYAVCTTSGEKLAYSNFLKRYWQPLMQSLNLDYIPHETRHTCNSLLIMANVNPTIRKKIMGHKSQMDIGEAVYGHIYVEELLRAINQI